MITVLNVLCLPHDHNSFVLNLLALPHDREMKKMIEELVMLYNYIAVTFLHNPMTCRDLEPCIIETLKRGTSLDMYVCLDTSTCVV